MKKVAKKKKKKRMLVAPAPVIDNVAPAPAVTVGVPARMGVECVAFVSFSDFEVKLTWMDPKIQRTESQVRLVVQGNTLIKCVRLVLVEAFQSTQEEHRGDG